MANIDFRGGLYGFNQVCPNDESIKQGLWKLDTMRIRDVESKCMVLIWCGRTVDY